SPWSSRYRSTGWHCATGASVSSTVTRAVQKLLLPCPSLTKSVSAKLPMSAQVNADCEPWKRSRLSWSVLPPSRSAAVMDAVPDASKYTVTSLQTGMGGALSITSTRAWQVALLPAASVTVSSTVYVPGKSKPSGNTLSETA